jgi:hypothetical protein
MLRGATSPQPLAGPWIDLPSQGVQVHVVPTSIAVGARYVLLREEAPDYFGRAVAAGQDQLELDGADSVTDDGDFLLLGGRYYAVNNVAPGVPRVATLDDDLPGTTVYRRFKTVGAESFDNGDRARLAKLTGQPSQATELRFEAPADPPLQPVDGVTVDQGAAYLALGLAWNQLPAGSSGVPAALTGAIGPADLSPILLPRNADNPSFPGSTTMARAGAGSTTLPMEPATSPTRAR